MRKLVLPPRTHIAIIASAALLLVMAGQWIVAALTPGRIAYYAAIDYTLYMDAATRWLHGGPFYDAYQLAGQYDIEHGAVLYPPIGLLLFAPFTILSAVLWWIIPAATTAYSIWRLRPAVTWWPLLALCLWWPPTALRWLSGNPVIWVLAAVSLGCAFGWPSVFALLKPSLFPFALIGVRSRGWWVALGVFVALSIPFGAMWIDWARTLVNSRGGGVLYSIQEVPILMLPVFAALASTRRNRMGLSPRSLAAAWTRALDARRP